MSRTTKSFILIVLLTQLPGRLLFGQAQGFSIDSFNASVQKLSSDSGKINLMIEREATLDCEDSIAKLQLISQSKKLAEKIKWRPGFYQSNRALTGYYIRCSKNYQKVFEIFQESAERAQKEGDSRNEALSYEGMAKNYNRLNQIDKSIEYFKKVLIFKLPSDLEIGTLADIGLAYGKLGDYPNSIIYYDSSLKAIESDIAKRKSSELSDTTMKVGIKLNMADIYLITPNPEKAMATFEDALRTSKVINNKRFIELCLTGIGKTFRQLKQYSQANEYFQNALLVSRERSRFDDEISILCEIANTYMDSGVFKKALEYADTALSLADVQHFPELLSKTNATLGNAYLRENQPTLALFYLHRALDYSLQAHSLNDQKDAWYGLYNAYRQSGQFEKSLEAYQNFINDRDSARNIEKTNEGMRKDMEIANRTERLKQAADYEKKSQRLHLITYGGYGGLAMVIALTFFVYRNYNTQKKYNALLSKEKKLNLAHIAAQSDVLSDIAHIQAHEIRGPVSAILGFVQIYNFDEPADPNNNEIMHWIGESATKLDMVVRNVVSKENELREEHKDDNKQNDAASAS